MQARPDTIVGRALRGTGVLAVAVAVVVLMTWPLAKGMGRLGRTGSGDGLFSIWNVAWVARTIVADPVNLFRANIFFPHEHALAYSEANIGAGVLAIPAWWLTQNPYTALNTALLLAFATNLIGMWLLARYLCRDKAAAAIAALIFSFCPYLFSHTAHIQLLMAGGIPLSLLMLHRVADAPSWKTALALGLALAVQALSCAYYGIFTGLVVGYAALFLTVSRATCRTFAFWRALAIAAAASGLCVLPFFLPYIDIREQHNFRRSIEEAMTYSGNLMSYLTSSSHAHKPVLALARRLGPFEGMVGFPGYLAIVFGLSGLAMGAVAARRSADRPFERETALLYGSIGVLALWASLGPRLGLYTALFRAVPLFSFLRAPSRFNLVVVFSLAVLASLALSRLFQMVGGTRRRLLAAGLAAAAIAELNILPFPWEAAPRLPPSYRVLAKLPRGPLAEFPFYGARSVFHLHTQYQVFSTAHWMPMLNGYSDVIPVDFRETAPILESFPSNEAFDVLRKRRTRYVGVHWDMYGQREEEIRTRLIPFRAYLQIVAEDEMMTLYEVIRFP
ncbi:MAG: hypothetical protein A3H96_12680 [Acidobacteria bacterium RIFCSPLOWO2_02_FULL_67_36]|nr:MAG: hypothetical protein A3H96_12680 [Acidobacteria bacterium RIFCSPLOWO2_02_FULL_67_36]OFW23484.1 MAG: hypothetical protein A3G21_05990 [Acidobacteria bacterium RIFCSPLOWO2_12_FULL_66_21]